MNGILTAMSLDADASRLKVLDEIKAEAGVDVTDEDLDFLGALIRANSLAEEARKILHVACKK